LNRELLADLGDASIPGNIKAKQHYQNLNIFLHTSKQLPVTQPETLINLKTPTVDYLLGIEIPAKKVKKKKKHKVLVIRKSSRKPKPVKLNRETWT